MHIRFLFICCLLIAQSVTAVEMAKLFTANVTARSQSREHRNSAIREALQTVIGRLTPGKGFAQNPVVKTALDNAASYVDQYRYAPVSGKLGKTSPRLLRVTFNKDTVMALMHSSGLAVWDTNRDKTLLWLAIEQGGIQVFLDVDQHTEVEVAIQSVADEQGIPLLLPLMDLEEKQAITVKDILAKNSEKIMAVSARYDVATILSGKLVKRRSCWRSEWILYFNNNTEQWVEPCADLKTNLTHTLQSVYHQLAVFYAVNDVGKELADTE